MKGRTRRGAEEDFGWLASGRSRAVEWNEGKKAKMNNDDDDDGLAKR